MERIPIRITALLAMTTLAACDFLDIDTPGIVNRDKMFENEQGFIDAMNGVYASMADADLYGEQLSFGSSTKSRNSTTTTTKPTRRR